MYNTLYTQDVLNGDEWRYFLNLESYLIKRGNRNTKQYIFLNINPKPGRWRQDKIYNIENKLSPENKQKLMQIFTDKLDNFINGFKTALTVELSVYNNLIELNEFIKTKDIYTEELKIYIQQIVNNFIVEGNTCYYIPAFEIILNKPLLLNDEYNQLPMKYKEKYEKCVGTPGTLYGVTYMKDCPENNYKKK